MDITLSARRKRKASYCVPMHLELPFQAPGPPDGALYETLAPLSVSPKRAALESGCSDISCQSELLCGEWMDQMSMRGALDCSSTPSLSPAESLASYLSVTTEGTPTAAPASTSASLTLIPRLHHSGQCQHLTCRRLIGYILHAAVSCLLCSIHWRYPAEMSRFVSGVR